MSSVQDDGPTAVLAVRTDAETVEVSFTDEAVRVLETACTKRAEWARDNRFVEESYLYEDLAVVLTSEKPVALSPVEVARFADAARWLAATNDGTVSTEAEDVEADLREIVAKSVEADK